MLFSSQSDYQRVEEKRELCSIPQETTTLLKKREVEAILSFPLINSESQLKKII